MAAKVWTYTLLSCSFTHIRGAPFVSYYVYMPPRSTAMVVYKYIMWHIMPWICAYTTLCLYDIWIYNLSNITCHFHKSRVWNTSRLHIVRVRHPRQRAGIATAHPADSLAHRATASCTPIVHPPSWQPGPSGNRQLHAHSAPPADSLAHRATASCMPIVHPPSWQPGPSGNRQLHVHSAPAQLTAWPIGQPPAACPLCTRPADSLAHRATASCTSIVHPPSWQPGPSGNRQLHAHSAPPAASLAHRATASCMPTVHPPSCQPGPSGNRQRHARLTPSCTVNSRAAPGPPLSAPASTPSPVPSNLWLISPLSPHITDEDETRMPVFKCWPS